MFKFLAGSKATGAAVASVVLLGGVASYYATRPAAIMPEASVEPAMPEASQTAQPQQAAVPKAAPPQTPPVDVQSTPQPAAPLTFDTVRQEPDGTTIIAGQAAPGTQVRVLQDGTQIAMTTADATGKFAAIAFVLPDGKGHVLSLVQTLDGADTVSPDQIILAPLAPLPPVQVAQATQAEPEPTPQPSAVPPLAPTRQASGQQAPPQATPPQQTAQQTPPEAVSAQQVASAPVEAPDPTDTDHTATAPAAPLVAPQTVTAQQAAPTAPVRDVPVVPVVPDAQTEIAALAPAPEGLDVVQEQPVATQATSQVQRPEGSQTPALPPQQPVAVLKTTELGVDLLNVPKPEAMDNVALDTISYSQAGDVQLSGRAQPNTDRVQVYLNNTSVISLKVDASGRWRGDVPDVDEGIYTLRVDEVSQSGQVTSRVETPFKRESPEVLARAAAAQDGPLKQITVQKGATLWGIAEERYGSGLLFVNVFEANGDQIRDPNLIYPGQVFSLPLDDDG